MEAKFEKIYHDIQATADKTKRRQLIGKLTLTLIDASIAKEIDWRLVNQYARKLKPLKGKKDLMMRDLICDLEHWDDYTRDHGEFERIRQFALDISKGIFYEELTTVMVYYVKRQADRTLGGVSYVAWDDQGKLCTRTTNSLTQTLDPILHKSKNIDDFISRLPAKIGELELFDKTEVLQKFRFDIDV